MADAHTTRPMVTIGLITYNAAGTVARALESAIAQTWQPIELIVVDDASTDRTIEIVEGIARTQAGIRVLQNPTNSGASVARNRVMAEARGEFVAFFDDDDVSDSRRVELQVARILQFERSVAVGATVVCHSARLQHYPNGTSRIEPTMGQVVDRDAPSGVAVARRILIGVPLRNGYGSCATCSQLIRTDTLRQLGGFDPAFRRGQDTDLIIRLARAGAHFVGISEPLVTQTMTKTADKGLERERPAWLALAEKHREIFDSEPQYQFCRTWIEVRHDWLAGDRGAFLTRLLRLILAHPLLTWMRLWMSLPRLAANFAFSRFHRGL